MLDPRRATREAVAGDVVEMRGAIAKEKGDGDRWDLKYAAGGLVDIEFIAQYLQLVHAATHAGDPRHLDHARARQGLAARLAADRGRRSAAAGGAALSRPHADPAAVPAGPFDPKTAAPGLIGLLARAADVPDFATLDAFLAETQSQGARELRAHPRRGAVIHRF